MSVWPVGRCAFWRRSIGPSPGSYVVDVLLAVWWAALLRPLSRRYPAAVSRSDCAHVSAAPVRTVVGPVLGLAGPTGWPAGSGAGNGNWTGFSEDLAGCI